MNSKVGIFIELLVRYYSLLNGLKSSRTVASTERNGVLIHNFYKKFEKHYGEESIGEELMKEYLEYSIGICKSKKLPSFLKNYPLSWILSSKHLERFKKKSTKENFTVTKLVSKIALTDKSGITTKESRKKKETGFNEILSGYNEYEEREKRRFLNDENGYVYCEINTTMFHPESECCIICDFRKNCKERLKLNYPALFKARVTNYGREGK